MWSLHKIKFVQDDKVLSYCQDNLEYIGKGTGRKVFSLTDNLVIKVAYNHAGTKQSEVEWSLRDNNICANIHYKHKDYLWVVMDKVVMYDDDGYLENITGSTFTDRVVWCEYNQLIILKTIPEQYKEKIKQRYDNAITNDVDWLERMNETSFITNLTNFIIDNKMESGDLIRNTSWGYKHGEKETPLVFDYGLSNNVWVGCYNRVKHTAMVGGEEQTLSVVNVIGHEKGVGDMVTVLNNGKEKEVKITG